MFKTGQRDPEMHETKKGNQWHFGMKALRVVKQQFGRVKVRYRGMARNTTWPTMLLALSNRRKDWQQIRPARE